MKKLQTFEQHTDDENIEEFSKRLYNKEVKNDSDVLDIMKRSVAYYEYIDDMGEKISKIIVEQIEPLLKKKKFDEAKQMVRDFYKPSRLNDDVIFIEYDMIMANINRRKNKEINM